MERMQRLILHTHTHTQSLFYKSVHEWLESVSYIVNKQSAEFLLPKNRHWWKLQRVRWLISKFGLEVFQSPARITTFLRPWGEGYPTSRGHSRSLIFSCSSLNICTSLKIFGWAVPHFLGRAEWNPSTMCLFRRFHVHTGVAVPCWPWERLTSIRRNDTERKGEMAPLVNLTCAA